MEAAPNEKLYVTFKPDESDTEDDYYEVKKAPMMMLLPGGRPTSADTPSKKLSDALSSNKDETEDDTEYTYETEEEEEEEEGLEDMNTTGFNTPLELDSYEAKAERALEDQRERVSMAPVLDYIDEEDEDIQPQVSRGKNVSTAHILPNLLYICFYFFYLGHIA